jgi:hypothetical protein
MFAVAGCCCAGRLMLSVSSWQDHVAKVVASGCMQYSCAAVKFLVVPWSAESSAVLLAPACVDGTTGILFHHHAVKMLLEVVHPTVLLLY